MRYLAKVFPFFLIAIIIFISSLVSYHCGRSQGFADGKKYSYDFALKESLKKNHEVQDIIERTYTRTFRAWFDSVAQTDQVDQIVKDYLKSIPLCTSIPVDTLSPSILVKEKRVK